MDGVFQRSRRGGPEESIQILAVEAAVSPRRAEETHSPRVGPTSQRGGIHAEHLGRLAEGQPAQAAPTRPLEPVHNLGNSMESYGTLPDGYFRHTPPLSPLPCTLGCLSASRAPSRSGCTPGRAGCPTGHSRHRTRAPAGGGSWRRLCAVPPTPQPQCGYARRYGHKGGGLVPGPLPAHDAAEVDVSLGARHRSVAQLSAAYTPESPSSHQRSPLQELRPVNLQLELAPQQLRRAAAHHHARKEYLKILHHLG